MTAMDWKLEQERHALKAARYKNLVVLSEWTEFVKDIKSQIETYKNLAVSAVQENRLEDSKKYSFIVMGLEEAISRPQDVMNYHEKTYKKMINQTRMAFDNFARWMNKSEPSAA